MDNKSKVVPLSHNSSHDHHKHGQGENLTKNAQKEKVSDPLHNALEALQHQKQLFQKSLIVMCPMVVLAGFIRLWEILILTQVVGKTVSMDWAMSYHLFAKAEENEQEQVDYFHGIDYSVMASTSTLSYWFICASFAFYYQLNRAALAYLLIAAPINFATSLVVFYMVDLEGLGVVQVLFLGFLFGLINIVVPEQILLLLGTGIFREWKIGGLIMSTMAYSTSVSSAMYMTLTLNLPDNILWDILLMGIGYPLVQFSMRACCEQVVRKLLSKMWPDQETGMRTGAVISMVESIVSFPAFLVLFLNGDEAAFYSSITISFAVEVLELYPLTTLISAEEGKEISTDAATYSDRISSRLSSRHIVVPRAFQLSRARFALFISNSEQGEKTALVAAILMNFYWQSFSSMTIMRSLYALLIEAIVDILRARICASFGVHINADLVDGSWSAYFIYICGCSAGVSVFLNGAYLPKYIS